MERKIFDDTLNGDILQRKIKSLHKICNESIVKKSSEIYHELIIKKRRKVI